MTEPTPPTEKELKDAFKAFKKRLKLTQLDEDSKVSQRPTTSGGSTAIVAIAPPNQFTSSSRTIVRFLFSARKVSAHLRGLAFPNSCAGGPT